MRLCETAAERELQDSLAELYSIITTLEGLEKAYIRDSVAEDEYTELCTRLLKQYKSSLSNDQVALAFGDLDSFQREWDVSTDDLARVLSIDGLPARQRATEGQLAGHDR